VLNAPPAAPLYRASGFVQWHETDMPTALRDVRSQEQSGKHLLTVSSSQFDPDRTSKQISLDLPPDGEAGAFSRGKIILDNDQRLEMWYSL
jgi:hypothetical protein